MSLDKALEIVKQAMTDRSVYDAMAARENEVWGTILPALEDSEAKLEDAAAAASLNANRHQSYLIEVAREKNLKFQHGLTIGCGAGRLERALLQEEICSSFHGIDISEKAIATARRIAKEKNLDVTYEVADVNFVKLPEKKFDLIAAQTSLHHILFLERVAEQVWYSLKPDGYLWIHDFIGEMQWQYDSKRLSIANQLLAFLPEKFRKNKITNSVTTEIKRPEPGNLGSPFESIRSNEIIPVFQRWFAIEWRLEFSAFLHLIAPPGTRAAYVENDDTKALFEALLLLDHVCIQERILQPTGGQYLMRPKSSEEVSIAGSSESETKSHV